MSSIDHLKSLEKEASLVGSIASILHWDQECHMPPKASDYRGEQMAFLAKVQHEKSTSPEIGKLIEGAQAEKETLSAGDRRSLELSARQYEREKSLPADLVGSIACETAKAHRLWADARAQKDASIFLPQLRELVRLTKEKARCYGAKEGNLYDALLGDFEWGMTSEKLDTLFGELKSAIPNLVTKITKEKKFINKLGDIKVSVANQEAMGRACLELMGFDESRTNLSVAVHPFCTTLGPNDFRITTRYDEKNFIFSLLGTAHEMGHSLYEQGLPSDLFGTARGQACSFGFHESQSLFWEKKVVSSKEFLNLLWPVISKSVNSSFDDFYHTANLVENSLIRVDSDEVTYCLHIIIRYEVEKLLMNENLPVEEIAEVWNRKYEEYLGITPPSDAEGFLQDVHWSGAAFGYFPSYAIGHIISSQLEQKIEKDLAPLKDLISSKRIPEIISWLRTHVHEKAFSYDPADLIQDIVGNDFSTKPFISYLERKFLS